MTSSKSFSSSTSPSLSKRELETIEHLGKGICLNCQKKISTTAYYCTEKCEVNFNEIELNLWSNAHNEVVVIESFFEFLSSKGIVLQKIGGEYGDLKSEHCPSLQDLIYEHYEIDKDELERERRVLLSRCQSK